VQVRAGLGALHKAIDRNLVLVDQRACHETGCGSGTDLKEAQQGQDGPLELSMAPAPATADLVYE
jgi:hypothetical protein